MNPTLSEASNELVASVQEARVQNCQLPHVFSQLQLPSAFNSNVTRGEARVNNQGNHIISCKNRSKPTLWRTMLSECTPVTSPCGERIMCRSQQHPGFHGMDICLHEPEWKYHTPFRQLEEPSMRAQSL